VKPALIAGFMRHVFSSVVFMRQLLGQCLRSVNRPQQETNSRPGCHGSDLNVKSGVLQAVHEWEGLLALSAVVEVVCAEVLMEGSVFEHMAGGGED